MKKTLFVILIMTIFLMGGLSFAGENSKVTICHIPPGNPDNPQTITVSANALEAHLAHGDFLGECRSGCNLDPRMCDDEDLCTYDICLANGECQHLAVNCDDGNICTNDICTPTEGCVYAPIDGIQCDDGNVCTDADTCQNTLCVGQPVVGCCNSDIDCDDGDNCTFDTCSGDNTCSNVSVDCTVTDACLVGFCNPSSGQCETTPTNCDDSNVCTDDYCDSVTGCYSLPTDNPPELVEETCDDGVDNDCDGPVDSEDPDCVECVSDADCDDGCACSVDTCSELAGGVGCNHEFSGCFIEVTNSGPVSAGSVASVNVNLSCAGQVSRVTCTTSTEQCIGSMVIPLTDNDDGAYTGSFAVCEATSVTVTCDWITPDGSFSDDTIVQFF